MINISWWSNFDWFKYNGHRLDFLKVSNLSCSKIFFSGHLYQMGQILWIGHFFTDPQGAVKSLSSGHSSELVEVSTVTTCQLYRGRFFQSNVLFGFAKKCPVYGVVYVLDVSTLQSASLDDGHVEKVQTVSTVTKCHCILWDCKMAFSLWTCPFSRSIQ